MLKNTSSKLQFPTLQTLDNKLHIAQQLPITPNQLQLQLHYFNYNYNSNSAMSVV